MYPNVPWARGSPFSAARRIHLARLDIVLFEDDAQVKGRTYGVLAEDDRPRRRRLEKRIHCVLLPGCVSNCGRPDESNGVREPRRLPPYEKPIEIPPPTPMDGARSVGISGADEAAPMPMQPFQHLPCSVSVSPPVQFRAKIPPFPLQFIFFFSRRRTHQSCNAKNDETECQSLFTVSAEDSKFEIVID